MDDTVEESNVSTCLTIKAMKSSTWSSKGPSWTISLVDENTFRFSADDSDESFDQSLAIIEEHAQLFPIPILSFAVISLKDSNQKKVYFRIEKYSIPIWNEMKGPPTVQGLALTLKRVTKPDIPWGIMLVALSLLPDPEVEKQGLIQDLDSALLGLSLLGIAVVARKIPQATFFLFQMTWELVFLFSILVNGIDDGGDRTMQVIQGVIFVFCLVFFRHRIIQHYENYKRYSPVT
ncbi:hypothetical protein OAF45_01090 [Candidatus Latescibacteria bacterium]|nr:hypothetical protein [Candidatus Latescibacterota bacterium]